MRCDASGGGFTEPSAAPFYANIIPQKKHFLRFWVKIPSMDSETDNPSEWLSALLAKYKDGAVAGSDSNGGETKKATRVMPGFQLVADENGYGIVKNGEFDEEGNMIGGEYIDLENIEAIDAEGNKGEFDGTATRIEADLDGKRVRMRRAGDNWEKEEGARFGEDFIRGFGDIVLGLGIGGRSIAGMDDSEKTEEMYEHIVRKENRGPLSQPFKEGGVGRAVGSAAASYPMSMGIGSLLGLGGRALGRAGAGGAGSGGARAAIGEGAQVAPISYGDAIYRQGKGQMNLPLSEEDKRLNALIGAGTGAGWTGIAGRAFGGGRRGARAGQQEGMREMRQEAAQSPGEQFAVDAAIGDIGGIDRYIDATIEGGFAGRLAGGVLGSYGESLNSLREGVKEAVRKDAIDKLRTVSDNIPEEFRESVKNLIEGGADILDSRGLEHSAFDLYDEGKITNAELNYLTKEFIPQWGKDIIQPALKERTEEGKTEAKLVGNRVSDQQQKADKKEKLRLEASKERERAEKQAQQDRDAAAAKAKQEQEEAAAAEKKEKEETEKAAAAQLEKDRKDLKELDDKALKLAGELKKRREKEASEEQSGKPKTATKEGSQEKKAYTDILKRLFKQRQVVGEEKPGIGEATLADARNVEIGGGKKKAGGRAKPAATTGAKKPAATTPAATTTTPAATSTDKTETTATTDQKPVKESKPESKTESTAKPTSTPAATTKPATPAEEKTATPQPTPATTLKPAEVSDDGGRGSWRVGEKDESSPGHPLMDERETANLGKEINIDTARFQMKSEAKGSKRGIIQEIEGMKYIGDKEQPLHLWRNKEGVLYLAHGHHRKDLYERLWAEKDKTGMPERYRTYIYEESEGVSAAQARALAAIANTEQGNLKPMDYAVVMRDPNIFSGMPGEDRVVEDLRGMTGRDLVLGRGLSMLSEKAFAYVGEGSSKVPIAYGAEAGYADLSEENQIGLMQRWLKAKPKTIAEAKWQAQAARTASAVVAGGGQGTLGGIADEEIVLASTVAGAVFAYAADKYGMEKSKFGGLSRTGEGLHDVSDMTDDEISKVIAASGIKNKENKEKLELLMVSMNNRNRLWSWVIESVKPFYALDPKSKDYGGNLVKTGRELLHVVSEIWRDYNESDRQETLNEFTHGHDVWNRIDDFIAALPVKTFGGVKSGGEAARPKPKPAPEPSAPIDIPEEPTIATDEETEEDEEEGDMNFGEWSLSSDKKVWSLPERDGVLATITTKDGGKSWLVVIKIFDKIYTEQPHYGGDYGLGMAKDFTKMHLVDALESRHNNNYWKPDSEKQPTAPKDEGGETADDGWVFLQDNDQMERTWTNAGKNGISALIYQEILIGAELSLEVRDGDKLLMMEKYPQEDIEKAKERGIAEIEYHAKEKGDDDTPAETAEDTAESEEVESDEDTAPDDSADYSEKQAYAIRQIVKSIQPGTRRSDAVAFAVNEFIEWTQKVPPPRLDVEVKWDKKGSTDRIEATVGIFSATVSGHFARLNPKKPKMTRVYDFHGDDSTTQGGLIFGVYDDYNSARRAAEDFLLQKRIPSFGDDSLRHREVGGLDRTRWRDATYYVEGEMIQQVAIAAEEKANQPPEAKPAPKSEAKPTSSEPQESGELAEVIKEMAELKNQIDTMEKPYRGGSINTKEGRKVFDKTMKMKKRFFALDNRKKELEGKQVSEKDRELAGEDNAAPETSSDQTAGLALVDKLAEMLENGEKIKDRAALQKMAKDAGVEGDSHAIDNWLEVAVARVLAKEAKGLRFLLDVSVNPISGMIARLQDAEELKNLLPQQTQTPDKQQTQAYSTPPDVALLASYLLNANEKARILEPSAGTGILAAVLNKPTLNEWYRAEYLRAQGYENVMEEDASKLADVEMGEFDGVLMNPPFSSEKSTGKKNSDVAYNHLKAAWGKIRPGGRMVAITGWNQNPADMDFVKEEGDASISLIFDGSVYSRMGAKFPIRLTLIDKEASMGGTVENEVKPKVRDIEGGFMDAVEGLRFLQDEKIKRPAELEAKTSEETPAKTTTPKKPSGGSQGGLGTDAPSTPSESNQKPSTRHEDADKPLEEGKKPVPLSEVVKKPVFAEPVEADPIVQEVRTTQANQIDAEMVRVDSHIPSFLQANPSTNSIRQTQAIVDTRLSGNALHHIQTAAQEAYFHPDLSAEKGGVKLNMKNPPAPLVPFWQQVAVATEIIGALQVNRAYGLFAAMGLGKTIMMAMVANHFIHNSKSKKAIYVGPSARWFLEDDSDTKGGLGKGHKSIAAAGIPLQDIRMFNPKGRNDLKQGVIYTTYDTIKRKDKGIAIYKNMEMLVELVGGADFDGLIIFDENDKAANIGSEEGGRGGNEPSQNYIGMSQLQQALPKAKIIYGSGTATTKEQKSIMAMDGLPLWGANNFMGSREQFQRLLERHGLLFLEEAASYLRHIGVINYMEQNRDGVEEFARVIEMTEEQIYVSDQMAKLWRKWGAIVDDLATDMMKKNRSAAGAFLGHLRNDLASQMGKSVRSVNTAHRVRKIAEIAVKAMKDEDNEWGLKSDDGKGFSPIIYIVETGEARIERAIKAAMRAQKVRAEELDVSQIDFSVRGDLIDVFEKALWRFELEPTKDHRGKATFDFVRVKNNDGSLKLMVYNEKDGSYRLVPEGVQVGKNVWGGKVKKKIDKVSDEELDGWEEYHLAKHPKYVPMILPQKATKDDETGEESSAKKKWGKHEVYQLFIKNTEMDKFVEEMIGILNNISFPNNAMDVVINYITKAMGPGAVKELTGRSGGWRSDGRNVVRVPKASTAKAEYMQTPNAAAIISGAYSRGGDFQDNINDANKNQRLGMFGDMGRVPNTVMQMRGRILREGQLQKPKYVYVMLNDIQESRDAGPIGQAIAVQSASTGADRRGKGNFGPLAVENDIMDKNGQNAFWIYMREKDTDPKTGEFNQNRPYFIRFARMIHLHQFDRHGRFDMKKTMDSLAGYAGFKKVIGRLQMMDTATRRDFSLRHSQIRNALIEDQKNSGVELSGRARVMVGESGVLSVEIEGVYEKEVQNVHIKPKLIKFKKRKQVFRQAWDESFATDSNFIGVWNAGHREFPARVVLGSDYSETDGSDLTKMKEVYRIYSVDGFFKKMTTDEFMKVLDDGGMTDEKKKFTPKTKAQVKKLWNKHYADLEGKSTETTEYLLEHGLRFFGEEIDKMKGIRDVPRDIYPSVGESRAKISGILLSPIDDVGKMALNSFIKKNFSEGVEKQSDIVNAFFRDKNFAVDLDLDGYDLQISYVRPVGRVRHPDTYKIEGIHAFHVKNFELENVEAKGGHRIAYEPDEAKVKRIIQEAQLVSRVGDDSGRHALAPGAVVGAPTKSGESAAAPDVAASDERMLYVWKSNGRIGIGSSLNIKDTGYDIEEGDYRGDDPKLKKFLSATLEGQRYAGDRHVFLSEDTRINTPASERVLQKVRNLLKYMDITPDELWIARSTAVSRETKGVGYYKDGLISLASDIGRLSESSQFGYLSHEIAHFLIQNGGKNNWQRMLKIIENGNLENRESGYFRTTIGKMAAASTYAATGREIKIGGVDFKKAFLQDSPKMYGERVYMEELIAYAFQEHMAGQYDGWGKAFFEKVIDFFKKVWSVVNSEGDAAEQFFGIHLGGGNWRGRVGDMRVMDGMQARRARMAMEREEDGRFSLAPKGNGELRRTGDAWRLRVVGVPGLDSLTSGDVANYYNQGFTDIDPAKAAAYEGALDYFRNTLAIQDGGEELMGGSGRWVNMPKKAQWGVKSVGFEWEEEQLVLRPSEPPVRRAPRRSRPKPPGLFAIAPPAKGKDGKPLDWWNGNGDWRLDPRLAETKVEKVVYHGTSTAGFQEFDAKMLGENTGSASAMKAFFFAGMEETASAYANPEDFNFNHLDAVRPGGSDRMKELMADVKAWAEHYEDFLEPLLTEQESINFQEQLDALGGESIVALADMSERVSDFIHFVKDKLEAEADNKSNQISDMAGASDEEIDAAESEAGISEMRRAVEEALPLDMRYDAMEDGDFHSEIKSVRLRLDNPMVIDYDGGPRGDRSFYSVLKEAEEKGHDGVIFQDVHDGGEDADDIYAVFSPDQIINADTGETMAELPDETGGLFALPADVLRDEDGEPLEMLHGTPHRFRKFKRGHPNGADLGVHFTPRYATALEAGLREENLPAYAERGKRLPSNFRVADASRELKTKVKTSIRRVFLRGNVFYFGEDAMEWNNPHRVKMAMLVAPETFKRASKETGGYRPLSAKMLDRILGSGDKHKREVEIWDKAFNSINAEGPHDIEPLRRALIDAGVDVLAYHNEAEGDGELSYIALHPKAIVGRTGKTLGADEGRFALVPPDDVGAGEKAQEAMEMYAEGMGVEIKDITPELVAEFTDNNKDKIKEIWQKTGMILGIEPEPQLRMEIDNVADIDWEALLQEKKGWEISLGQIAEWPALFDIYPKAKDIKITFGATRASAGNQQDKGIHMPVANSTNKKRWMEILDHEVQHYIQDHAGFSSGYKDRGGKFGKYQNSSKAYWNAAGEAEAREVVNRRNKSAAWRAANPPQWDGIPFSELKHRDYSSHTKGFLTTGDMRYGRPTPKDWYATIQSEEPLTNRHIAAIKRSKPIENALHLLTTKWEKYGRDERVRDLIRLWEFAPQENFGEAKLQEADMETFGKSLDDAPAKSKPAQELVGAALNAVKRKFEEELGYPPYDDNEAREWWKEKKKEK